MPAEILRHGARRDRYRAVIVNNLGFLLLQSLAILVYFLIGSQGTLAELLVALWFTAGPIAALLLIRATGSIDAAIVAVQAVAQLGLLFFCWFSGGVRSPFVPIMLLMPAQAFAFRGTRDVVLAFLSSLAIVALLIVGSWLELVPPSIFRDGVPTAVHAFGVVYPLVLISALSWLSERGRAHIRAQLVHARDIAEQSARELEVSRAAVARHAARAEEASRAKSAFVAYLTHEIRTPISAIVGYAELLEESLADDPERLPDIRRIRGATRHILALVNNVLDLSKIEAGKMEVTRTPTPVPALVEDVVDSCEHLITRNNNRLEVAVDPALATLVLDRMKVTQVLVNLLANAGKFTHDGLVRLELAADGEGPALRLRAAVTDTGIGMTAAQIERALREFEQATPETASRYGGTGLGLPLSHRLCALMGGELRIASEPGRGTTVVVTVPAALA